VKIRSNLRIFYFLLYIINVIKTNFIMIEWHKKIQKLDLTKWIVTKFYHYTSICQDIYGEYDTMWSGRDPVGDPYIRELFQHFMSIVELYYRNKTGNEHSTLYDNKITIEITNIEDGSKLYISSKDGRYLIGKSVWSEFGTVTNFGVIEK